MSVVKLFSPVFEWGKYSCIMLRKKIIVGAAVVLTMVLGAALLLGTGGDASVDPALPDPNGYDLIRQAAEMVQIRGLVQMRVEDLEALGAAELEKWVRTNQPALDLARRGLVLPGRVPMLASLEELGTHSTRWLLIHSLAVSLGAEGRWLESRGDLSGAARAYLDIVRLGPATAQGGLVGDLTGGLAIARLGADRLLEAGKKLSPAERRDLALALREQIRRFPPVTENEANERALFARRASFGKKVSMMISRRLPVWQSGAIAMRAKAERGLAWLRQRAAELSSEADSPNAK